MFNSKVLFIGHDANRAGAQYLLLHLLTYLKQAGVQTSLLLTGDGPLRPEYERVTTVYTGFVHPHNPSIGTRILRRLQTGNRQKPASPVTVLPAGLLDTLRAQQFDLIFSNTIANGSVLRTLQPLGIPFVSYVHELQTSIGIYTHPADLQFQLSFCRHFLCGSGAVQDNLINNHKVDRRKTTVLNSIVRAETLTNALANVDRLSVRKRLGIPPDAVVVGGCGNAEWRKGVDLFALVAQQVLSKNNALARPEVHFIWVGVPQASEEYQHLTYDLARMGLTDRVHLIEPGGDYLNYVACFDLFTLTSREDPYPLVMLEAGLNYNPVLTFQGSGGSADYVGHDTGCLIPYADVSAMATVLDRLINDPFERRELGEVFYQRAMAHDTSVLAPRLLSILSTFINHQPVSHGYR
ncbi:glycosyl transferase group 1 [Fibrisoma limi BUZ 3]|uniref:Glycosyl transferase group 1 n=1 Tax=Fibrisoma limi BUZ 3 TaxID=1185876 RepID=I2GPY4_9BACT|nr:glycosyltransferase family 4 protein [Fibrisoma limi]CCH55962.1 glycosyl transferase group 1 [Fibrisoma limi BUZ 3]